MADDNSNNNAALLNTAGSIAGNATTGFFSFIGSRRQNHRNVANWRMQNDYNHPTAQMERLREAGLNPNLIYGTSASGATGQADKIAPSDKPTATLENPMRPFFDAKVKQAQYDNLRTMNTVNEQTAALKAAQVATELGKGTLTRVKAELAEQLKQNSLDAAKESLRQQELKNIQLELDNRFKDETLRNRALQIKYEVDYIQKNMEGQEKLNRLRQLEIQLNEMGLQKTDPLWMRIFTQKGGDIMKMVPFIGNRSNEDFEPY